MTIKLLDVDHIGLLVDDSKTSFVQHTTIQHWQLRDLVHTSSTSDDVFFPQDSFIRNFNFKKKQSFVTRWNGFAPTCMTIGYGLLVTGGQRSQLSVSCLGTGNTLYNGSIGDMVNNGLDVTKTRSGKLLLAVANNDENIRMVDIETMQIHSRIECTCPVNAVSISPDGKYLVAAFDLPYVLLFSLSSQGHYTLIAELHHIDDAGISCAWNTNSSQFAVASQDGSAVVYDIRALKPLVVLRGRQASSGGAGAVRCVKFASKGALDLLAFTEHTNYIHVVDMRADFSRRQSERLQHTRAIQDVHISGFAFSNDGSSIYVGTEASIIRYSVDTVQRRSFADAAIL
mmetsp:Transcript_5835/g.10323  ORF Transcript_5835/g.10323 Transcript_5835/m.10323 type:complete len:342 (+) Transcript_5835:2096-3121(+)